MGKHIEYSTEKELDEAVATLMEEDAYARSISEVIKVAGCFIVRMDDNDQTLPGKGSPVAIKKVPPEMQILMKNKPHFILVVDYHWWQTESDEIKKGHLALAVSRIKVDKTEDGIKTGTRPYDVQTNIGVVERYGLFTENLSLLGETISAMNKKLLSVCAGGIAKAKAKAKTESEESGEGEEPDDPPRVVARPIPKKSASDEAPERTRPPRRIPPDPEPAEGDEPEPED